MCRRPNAKPTLAVAVAASTVSPIRVGLASHPPNVDASKLNRGARFGEWRIWRKTYQHVAPRQIGHVEQASIAEADKIMLDVLGDECDGNASEFVVGVFRVPEADLCAVGVTNQLSERQLQPTGMANEMTLKADLTSGG